MLLLYAEGVGFLSAKDLQKGDRLDEANDSNDARVIGSVREEHPEGIAVYNFEVAGDHTYFVQDGYGEQTALWVHNNVAGQHHFWPWAWGNGTPYGDSMLVHLTAAEHTHIHNAFSDYLHDVTGYRYGSMSGNDWINTYGGRQLNQFVHDFHRQYSSTPEGIDLANRLAPNSGLSLYDHLKAQYRYAVRKGHLVIP